MSLRAKLFCRDITGRRVLSWLFLSICVRAFHRLPKKGRRGRPLRVGNGREIDPALLERIWRLAREHTAAAPRLTESDVRRLKAILARPRVRRERDHGEPPSF